LVLSVFLFNGLIGVIKENPVMVLILALTLLISLSVHIILGNNLLAIYHFVMIWFNYIYVYLSFDKRNLATANEQQTNGPYYHSYERVLLNV
jgi:hypothetical protein